MEKNEPEGIETYYIKTLEIDKENVKISSQNNDRMF